MQPLNYERLLQDYNEGLNTRLRGFRPAEEYLDIWVPDNDHSKSILNLVEAAEMGGQQAVAIELGKDTLSELDLGDLENLLKTVGPQVKVSKSLNGAESVVLTVNFSKNSGKTSSSASKGPSPYRLSLSAKLGSGLELTREGALKDSPSGTLALSSSFEGSQLLLAIDVETNKIKAARFSSNESPEIKALLELFCELIEGLPVQEAADHGIIKLEYSLRDTSRKPKVSGIITPLNADPIFAIPTQLIRKLYQDFKDKIGYKEGVNFYDPMPSAEWLALSEEQKIEKAQDFANKFVASSPWKGAEISVMSVQGQGDTRVFCSVQGELSPAEKAKLLLNLELSMRHNLERRMEVFVEEKKDSNSKRRL